MPLQNRVTPSGEIVAVAARGTMLGNRGGRMHGAAKRLTNPRWVSRRWICCVLEFRSRHREVMAPHSYTELFFLDEATAFASGHRPCRECRAADFAAFKRAWVAANPAHGVGLTDSIDAIDRVLHAERTLALAVRPRVDPAAQPAGTFTADGDEVWLTWAGRCFRWAWEGYTPATAPRAATLLTPPSIVAAFAAGYRPGVHPSIS